MDTRQLKTFRTLAKNLSFSQTAEELNYAQSSISAQIRSLENELKLNLFDRLGKKVILTEAGSSVLEYANRFMALEEEFIESVKKDGALVGELKIYAPNSICVYLLPWILTQYREEHPGVHCKLRAHLGTRRALKELRSGTLDVLLVMEESFDEPEFNIIPLRKQEIIVVAGNDHRLAQEHDIELETLKSEEFILTEPTCGYRGIMTRRMLELGHKLSPVMWFDNAEAIKECVKSGMGIAFLPRMTVEEDIENNRLVQLDLVEKFDDQIQFQIVTHKNKWLTPALKTFIETLKNELHS